MKKLKITLLTFLPTIVLTAICKEENKVDQSLYLKSIDSGISRLESWIKECSEKGYTWCFWCNGSITTEIEFWLVKNKFKYIQSTRIDNYGSQASGVEIHWEHLCANECEIVTLKEKGPISYKKTEEVNFKIQALKGLSGNPYE